MASFLHRLLSSATSTRWHKKNSALPPPSSRRPYSKELCSSRCFLPSRPPIRFRLQIVVSPMLLYSCSKCRHRKYFHSLLSKDLNWTNNINSLAEMFKLFPNNTANSQFYWDTLRYFCHREFFVVWEEKEVSIHPLSIAAATDSIDSADAETKSVRQWGRTAVMLLPKKLRRCVIHGVVGRGVKRWSTSFVLL